jgi:riboflavin synthase
VFTGIISQIVTVLRHTTVENGLVLTFSRPREWNDLVLGESIASNGACLSVSEIRPNEYDCYLMGETLGKTTFGKSLPKRVNLERAMGVSDRFGGHFVTGHVDGIGTVVAIDKAAGWDMRIKFSHEFAGLVILKGSICIDGVSLTVSEVAGDTLGVSLIPHTLANTTLGELKLGDSVNLEFDMIGKYIANIMEARQDHANV